MMTMKMRRRRRAPVHPVKRFLGLTEALALVCGSVHEDLGRDDVPKGQEHLQDLRVGELLRQVVDEDVAALGTCGQKHKRLGMIRQIRTKARQTGMKERKTELNGCSMIIDGYIQNMKHSCAATPSPQKEE